MEKQPNRYMGYNLVYEKGGGISLNIDDYLEGMVKRFSKVRGEEI